MPEPRYIGLTYASVAGDHGAGGWQVHARSPGLGEDEERLLTARVVTVFDSHEGPLPAFVEPDAVAALPVRFSAEPVPGGTLIRSAVQAGADATGRPGNVFTTLLLDRSPGAAPAAIRLWRSADLLVPFGAPAVAAALPHWAVGPGPVVDAAAVADLLADPASWGPLTVLLDAVAAAAAGGRTVVLRARDQDEAALWVGAVCLLTAPAWSAGLRWSLYERSDAVAGLHLAAVPNGDEPARAGVVVLGTADEPDLGTRDGEDHTTDVGDRVAVTSWSELVTELLVLEPEEVARLLDEVATTTGTGDGDPAWWLAVALLGSEHCPPDLAVAARSLLDRTPAPAGLDGGAAAVVDRALDVGEDGDPRRLRSAVLEGAPDDGRIARIAGRYVLAALADEEWLDAAEPMRPVPRPAARPDLDAVAAGLRGVTADGRVPVRRLANVLDALEVADALTAGGPQVEEPLIELVIGVAMRADAEDRAVFRVQFARLPGVLRRELLPTLAGLPGVLAEDDLLAAVAVGDEAEVRRLDEQQDALPSAVRDAVLLRLHAEEAMADRQWRLGLEERIVLEAADRLASGRAAATRALLEPGIRVLPAIGLLARRLGGVRTASPFEWLLRRRAPAPLPDAAVDLLADRLRDEDELVVALVYAAGDRSSAADDALRRALGTDGGDLLDLALARVLQAMDLERATEVLRRAEELADEGGRRERLWRRSSIVADYLGSRGVDLPRRVR